jgi:hypothetical protein
LDHITGTPGVDEVKYPTAADVGCPTKGWLRKHWGEPSETGHISKKRQTETWTYKFGGRVWCGVIPCIVVPIPLELPLSQNKVVFLVREGRAVKAEVVRCKNSGWIAGFTSGGIVATPVGD